MGRTGSPCISLKFGIDFSTPCLSLVLPFFLLFLSQSISVFPAQTWRKNSERKTLPFSLFPKGKGKSNYEKKKRKNLFLLPPKKEKTKKNQTSFLSSPSPPFNGMGWRMWVGWLLNFSFFFPLRGSTHYLLKSSHLPWSDGSPFTFFPPLFPLNPSKLRKTFWFLVERLEKGSWGMGISPLSFFFLLIRIIDACSCSVFSPPPLLPPTMDTPGEMKPCPFFLFFPFFLFLQTADGPKWKNRAFAPLPLAFFFFPPQINKYCKRFWPFFFSLFFLHAQERVPQSDCSLQVLPFFFPSKEDDEKIGQFSKKWYLTFPPSLNTRASSDAILNFFFLPPPQWRAVKRKK